MQEKSFTYWLPDENGERQEHSTKHNSIVIIGANGSGKSKLGAWIEEIDSNGTHRIAAQRKLNFKENIPLKNYEEAENIVRYGTATLQPNLNKLYRWTTNNETPTTRLIDDFEPVLAALLAKQNIQQAYFTAQCKDAEQGNRLKPNVPRMIVDDLEEVWRKVFPQRDLDIDDSKFYAILRNSDRSIVKYPANQMSDGERSVLYLTAQVLCLPENQRLIIDEPELHLHKSIMYPLWRTLENVRSDCLFIYITHDTDFAALHDASDKIWIQEFNGEDWKLETLEDSDLPESLLLELLGSRKNVIFIEGEKDSYDNKLYSLLYPEYYIVPCGGCEQVISRVRAFNRSSQLHRYRAYGIIDRDYKSEIELESYQNDNIFPIEVAEIENLFLTSEVLENISSHLALEERVVQEVKNQIIERFSQRKNEQSRLQAISRIKHRLSIADISGTNNQEIDKRLHELISEIDFSTTYSEILSKYEEVITSNNYNEIIKIFNDKKLSNEIGHFFGLQDKDFIKRVLNLLENNACSGLREAFLAYMPKQIPRATEEK